MPTEGVEFVSKLAVDLVMRMLYIDGVQLRSLGWFISYAIWKLQASIEDVCANIFVFKIIRDIDEGVVLGGKVFLEEGCCMTRELFIFWEKLANKLCNLEEVWYSFANVLY